MLKIAVSTALKSKLMAQVDLVFIHTSPYILEQLLALTESASCERAITR